MGAPLFHAEYEGIPTMSIVKNETDQLPADLIESRARTYTQFMALSYSWFGPIILGFVMVVFLWLLDVNLLTAFFLGFLTFLGVKGIAKTFFVH